MTHVIVTAGQRTILRGAKGDYYYLTQSGCAQVTKVADASQRLLYWLNSMKVAHSVRKRAT
ncbi:MAG: hypothetical protein PSV17_12850 [Methylotenera sp.]|uniref:hypothetical protein n=1 Tax=Methylotenera sp. TaxID=2051956 RepID=UPI002487B073|nr:hypothetical protein [Methylotenera sp.]MDI1310299.1 hypothetical protein [Methylotenera sp.]